MITTYFLIALGFLLFCLYMLHYAMANYRKARVSADWLCVKGALTDVKLWGKRKIDGEMVDCESLNIKYSYEVNGRKYVGTRVSFYTLHYPETIDFVKKHAHSSGISIYYNPQNPSESVVIPGLHPQKPTSEIWLAVIGVVVLFAVCVGVLLGEFK